MQTLLQMQVGQSSTIFDSIIISLKTLENFKNIHVTGFKKHCSIYQTIISSINFFLGEFPIQLAVKHSNLEMLNLFIEHNADTIVKDNRGQSLLHLAIYQKDEEICAKLISIGLDVNAQDEDGSTPLHVAVELNEIELVKTLLENEADIHKTDIDDYSPLHTAARVKNSSEILELLLKNKAKADAKTVHGDLALHIAAATG